MAREDINIRVSANVAEAIQLWKAMESGPQQMANAIDGMNSRGQKSTKELSKSLGEMAGQWTTVGAAIAGAKQILDAFIASQKAAMERQGDASKSTDQMGRELFNLTDGRHGLGQISRDFLTLGVRRNVAPTQAKEAVAALLGAGMSYDETVQGGGADAVLKTLAATNATGKNVPVKDLVDAMTGHLSASKQELSPANLAAAGQVAQAMFASTKLEITDLEQLAQVSAVIKQTTGLGNEQMALLSQFKDVTSANIGTTAMRGAVGRLLNAGNVRSSSAALKELGLKPEDVDFNGESFYDVQNRLGEAFDRAGPNAARLGYQLFGNEAVLAQSVLFSKEGAALTQERLRMARDTSSFERSAAVSEGSLAAKAAGEESAAALANYKEDYIDPDQARKALLTRMDATGTWAYKRVQAEAAFDATMYATQDAEMATRAATRTLGWQDSSIKEITDKARADTIPTVRIELTDQNQVAIPHQSNVSQVGKNKAPKER